MNCTKCGQPIQSGYLFCNNCGALVDVNANSANVVNQPVNNYMPPVESKPKKNILKEIVLWIRKNQKICAGIIIVGLVLAIIIVLTQEKRSETLMELEKDSHMQFAFGEEKYYLGQDAKALNKKGITYQNGEISDNDFIPGDSITVYPFYLGDKPIFLGALYCPLEDKCKYEDAILIKANFYERSNVVINDFLQIGMSYDEIKEKYGKEDGKFYQDENVLVWAFGEKGKIGQPYYLLGFNSYDDLEEIRVGIWWYPEEFEYTVK